MYDLNGGTDDKFSYDDAHIKRVVRKHIFGVSDQVIHKQPHMLRCLDLGCRGIVSFM